MENDAETNSWLQWMDNADKANRIVKENDDLRSKMADMQRHITLLEQIVLSEDGDGPIRQIDETLLDSAPASVEIVGEFHPNQQPQESIPPFAPASVEMEPQPEPQEHFEQPFVFDEPYPQQQEPQQQPQQPFEPYPQQQQQPQQPFEPYPQQQQEPQQPFEPYPQQLIYHYQIINYNHSGFPEHLGFTTPSNWTTCNITFQ
uniref:Amelogenin n=1 Tax=Panagrolaimus davidi TaxID=227884 RepID=A0A914R749_9BILA